MIKAGKLSHLIKELKQNHGKDQANIAKKRETSGKDKPLEILMVQPWQRIARQRITQTFSLESVISFPPLGEEDGTEGPMIIEAEMGGHCVHRIYVDGGSSSKILYEHFFRQISLLVRIGDEEHSMYAWMNFMVVRSPSPYNGIIGRPRVSKIRAILSTAHGMIKFLVAGGIVTLQSSRIILLECLMVSKPGVPRSAIYQAREEKIQVVIHLEYPEQTVAIGSTLTEKGRKELCRLLRCHLDVFAWKPVNMTGVLRAKGWIRVCFVVIHALLSTVHIFLVVYLVVFRVTDLKRIEVTDLVKAKDIRDQLNAEAKALQIILTGIDNDIYSTVNACPNACEMWKAIERLKQGKSINVQDLKTNLYWEFGKFTSQDGESLESHYSRFYKMMNEHVGNQCDVTNHQVNVQFLLQLQPEWQRFVTLVKQSQELKTVSYHKLYDILKQHQNEVNELRAERIARTANPLALVAQQQPVYHPQNNPTHYTQNSSTRSEQAATMNRGKAIVNSISPIYDQEPSMVAKDDEMSKDKKIDKLMALISLSLVNVVGARETVGTTVVQKSGIQCYNCKEFGHVTRECQKPKRAKEAAYHREKMLLSKQEEARIQLSADQADWKDDTENESKDQELEAHYIEHPKQSESVYDTYLIEQDEHNVIIDSLDMSYDREQIDQNDDDDDLANECELLASLIEKLKCEINDSKNCSRFLETSNKVLVEKLKETNALMYNDLKKFNAELDKRNDVEYASKAKEAQIKLYKTHEDKELDKVIALENKVKILNNIVYKTGQSVQTMNMLNSKCQTSFAKPKFLKKAQRANPRLYDIDEVTNLQCDYLELLEKCECLEKEFSKNKNDKSFKENQSKEFRKEREQYFEIQDLKAQLQDKSIVISEFKKLVEKLKGKSVDTKFEKSSVIRQPNAFKSQRPSILGKPTIFSDSFKRKDFSKSKSVTKNNVSNDFLKQVTAQTLPPNKKPILKNMNVLAPGMYKLHTEPTQTRTTQLPQDSRKTNKRVSFSTRVIPTTSFSRLQLKSNPMKDRVMLNNSQGKKQEVEDHRRNVKFSKNKTSVTAYNDSLKAKTSNVNFVCATCGKCVVNEKHDMCSKHMTGNLKLLIIFVEKFLGTVKFRNDQIAPIFGYGDLVQGAVKKRVYYVEGLWLVQRGLHAQIRIVRTDKGTKFLNTNFHAYFASEGILHQTSVA
nr:reverse transcriptase domain-containing protein [Tanacetum cinerariifolium]